MRLCRTVDVAKIAKVAGYDWLFIDLEHSAISIDTCAQMCVAALDAGITPIPRASAHESFHSTRPLDSGAQGIVVPHVSTVEEARRVADQCLYPPIGHRSVAGGLPQVAYESLPIADLVRVVNAQNLVVVMIETPEAVDNAEEIAAVPGIDVLLIGTNDLCAEMGIPGQFGHERVATAYDRVAAACRNSGKSLGMGGIYDEELSAKYIKVGAQFILAANDLSLMLGAASKRSAFLNGIPRS